MLAGTSQYLYSFLVKLFYHQSHFDILREVSDSMRLIEVSHFIESAVNFHQNTLPQEVLGIQSENSSFYFCNGLDSL